MRCGGLLGLSNSAYSEDQDAEVQKGYGLFKSTEESWNILRILTLRVMSLSFVKYLVVFYYSPVLSVFHSFLLLTCQFLALWLYICYFNLFCLESKYPCLLGHCMRYCLWTEGSEPPNGTWTLTLLSLDTFWFLPAFSLLHKCNFFVSFFSLKLHLTKWKKYKHPERALWNGLWSQTGMGSSFLSAPFCLVWCWASYLCP